METRQSTRRRSKVKSQPQPSLPMSPQYRPIKRNDNLMGSDKQYYENQDFGSVWLSEFLSYEKTRNESIAKEDLMKFTKLPGSTVHPAAEKNLHQHSKKAKKQSEKIAKSKSSMSADERRRLHELSRRLNNNSKPLFSMSQKGQKQRLTPYVEANTKISRVLKHVKLKTNKEDMEALQLNHFYELVARESKAAVRIQTQCRRVLATQHARQFKLEVMSATGIQSGVRMLLAKRLLGHHKERERHATLIRERFLRLFIARYKRRKRMKLEHISARLAQSIVRMYFARCVLDKKRQQHSWEINQQRWEALSTRLSWKHLRINFNARQIQCIVRRKLATTRVRKLHALYSESATTIQCIWRRFAAKVLKAVIAYRADVEKMTNKIRVISSEKEYWSQQVEELSNPKKVQHMKDLEIQTKKWQNEASEKEDQINTLESHYKDQLDLLDQISPSAISSGWEEQLKINIADTRERITGAKLDLLFRIQINLKKAEQELERHSEIQLDAKQSLDHWANWHQVEQDRLWAFQRQHHREVEGRKLRHAIVDEQLRWKVAHCLPSGKPDKRKPLPYGPVDNAIVESLIGKVKSKADDFQAIQHAENTFRPFQKLWDSLSAAANQFVDVEAGTIGGHAEDGISFGERVRKTADKTQENAVYENLDQASLQPQRQAFPRKLPFDLLEKMREERSHIETSLKPII